MRHLLAFALPIAVAALAYGLGLARTLGAHPFWADTVILIGTPVGLLLAWLLWLTPLNRGARAVLGLALLVAAYWVAATGQARFAASFAEDAFAGRIWYFGWIAVFAGLAASLAGALLRR